MYGVQLYYTYLQVLKNYKTDRKCTEIQRSMDVKSRLSGRAANRVLECGQPRLVDVGTYAV